MQKQFYLGLITGACISFVCFKMFDKQDKHELMVTPKFVKEADTAWSPPPTDAEQATIRPESLSANGETFVLSRPTSPKASLPTDEITQCNQQCVNNIVDRFLSGGSLSEQAIRDLAYNSHFAAERLAQNKALLGRFIEAVMQGTPDNVTHSLLRVAHHLPEDQATLFYHRLNGGSRQDRLNAISLLAMKASETNQLSGYLEQTVQSESDPEVLSASLSALNSVTHGYVSDTTLNAVSNHLRYHQDPKVRGKAMEVLSQWQHYDANVEAYLQSGLNSNESDLQRSSLLSLSNMLNSQRPSSRQPISSTMQDRIVAIANNVDLPADVRMQALSVMNLHLQGNQ